MYLLIAEVKINAFVKTHPLHILVISTLEFNSKLG